MVGFRKSHVGVRVAKYHQPSPYSFCEMDLNAKTYPKSPNAPDAHVDVHEDAHIGARGIA